MARSKSNTPARRTQAQSGEIINAPTGGAMQGFDKSAAAVGPISPMQQGAMSAIADAEARIKGRIMLARMNPRSEMTAHQRMLASCGRPTFADKGLYEYPRAGTTVRGLSINAATEFARLWGNIETFIDVISETDTQIKVRGQAVDLETNASRSSEMLCEKVQQRRDRNSGETNWVEMDERDKQELINRVGAKCVRNAIFALAPADFKEDFLNALVDTRRKVAAGQLKSDPEATIKILIQSFVPLGVKAEMIEARLGHAMRLLTPEELEELRAIYAALRDGECEVSAFFGVDDADGAKAKEANARIREKIESKRNKGKAPAAASSPAGGGTPADEPPANANADTPAPAATSNQPGIKGEKAWDRLCEIGQSKTDLEGPELSNAVIAFLKSQKLTRDSLSIPAFAAKAIDAAEQAAWK